MCTWFGYTVICIVLFIVLSRKNRIVAVYVKKWNSTQAVKGEDKEKECKRLVAGLGDAYKHHNIYSGKTGTYAMHNPAHIIPLIIIIPISITAAFIWGDASTYQYTILAAAFIIITGMSLYMLLSRRIMISPEGIRLKYKRKIHELTWNEIQTIGMTVKYETGRPKTGIGFVFISKGKIGKDLYVHPDNTNQLIEAGFIVLKFRPKVMHHILAYWNREVQGLERIGAWRRYVKRYNKKYE